MSACANCARELRPDWRFCIYCGTPTGVTSARPETRAIPIIASVPEPFAALHQPVSAPTPAPPLSATPAPPPPATPGAPSDPLGPAPHPAGSPVTAILADAPAPTLLVSDPHPPTVPVPLLTPPRRPRRRHRVNAFAIVALVLGCLANPLAALFGHLALVQLSVSGERGRIPAIIAIVLGYGSLAFILGLAIVYLMTRP